MSDTTPVGAGRTAKKQAEPPPAASAAKKGATFTKVDSGPDSPPDVRAAAPVSRVQADSMHAVTEAEHSAPSTQQSPAISVPGQAAQQKIEPGQRPEGEDAALQGQAAQLDSLTPQTWSDSLHSAGLVGIVYTIASNCELRARVGDELTLILDPDNAGSE